MFPGQTKNKVTYFRHLNVLNVSLNSKSDAKVILNIYVPLLSTNITKLFGDQFWKQVLDCYLAHQSLERNLGDGQRGW